MSWGYVMAKSMLLVMILVLAAAGGVFWNAGYRIPALMFAVGAAGVFWFRDALLHDEGFEAGRSSLDLQRSQLWWKQ